MEFENDTNRGRVQKMIETLGLIEKSAESNRASAEDMADMLAPFTQALSALCLPVDQARPAMPGPALTAGQRAALHLADHASLRDLMAALMGRLDAHAAKLDE